MQLEMGISTMRYFPASGTAGLARSFVSGNRRVPWPPPIMTESTLLVLMLCRPVCDIKNSFARKLLKEVIQQFQNRKGAVVLMSVRGRLGTRIPRPGDRRS